jgi:apolipoprotein N-acyltransferase
MQNELVFKTGLAKRTLGWLVCLGAAVALAAMIYGLFTHLDTQTPADLWSGLAIGVFLAGLMALGISIQNMRWSIEGETVVFHHLFGRRTIPVSGLAGYGKLVIVVSAAPLAHLDLYDRDLKRVVRLPVDLNDQAKAEAWFAERLRPVVNDGSAALPRLRFADTSKS